MERPERDNLHNLVPACASCNLLKRSMLNIDKYDLKVYPASKSALEAAGYSE